MSIAPQNQHEGTIGVPTIRVFFTGTDAVKKGYALCFDHDASAAADRFKVEKPSWANLLSGHFAGICDTTADANAAGQWINLIPLSGMRVPGCQVWTNESVAAGDWLGPIPDQYEFGRSVFVPAVIRVAATADRSTTAGLCHGTYGQYTWEDMRGGGPTLFTRVFDDFVDGGSVGIHGFTPAEGLAFNWLLRGASDTLSFATNVDSTSGAMGAVVCTAGAATTLVQLEQPGLPYLMKVESALFLRVRCKTDAVADEDVFIGLAIDGATLATGAGTVPALDDYIGFFNEFGVVQFAYNEDNGTDNETDCATTAVLDVYNDYGMYIRNRASGDKTARAYVDGTLVATISATATLFNEDEAMRIAVAAMDGTAVLTVDRIECNYHR